MVPPLRKDSHDRCIKFNPILQHLHLKGVGKVILLNIYMNRVHLGEKLLYIQFLK